MSAFGNGTDPVSGDDKSYTFKFDMLTIPIPSYLLAMAVGDLTSIPIGARSGVISEKININAYNATLSDLDMLLNRTEEYLTPYIWTKYNILILPASFPYGGMENPLLTFASPTIMQSDKS